MCSIILEEQEIFLEGPATVRMVSNSGPPLPMPMQVPPGHMVQQIIDENGILTNVILSSQPPGLSAPPVVVGYYGNPSGSPHHHHVYPQFGAHYPSYPSQYPVHHHHMHHHVGQPRMCGTSPNTLHHCTHPPPQPPSLPHNPLLNGPHFYPPSVLPPPPSHHHHHHHQFSTNHMEDRFTGRGFKSRPPNSRNFVKFKESNLIRSDHHHHHPFYFPSPPHPLPPPPHLHPPPHRLPMPPYLRGALPLKVNSNGRPRSLSTSSEDQELEEERQVIKEVLSRITNPKIVEIGAKYALILLTPPDYNQNELEIDFAEFVYELHLSEKDETGFNSVYSGDATEITLRDLKPATVYFIKVMVTLDNISGTQSNSVSFTTTTCEPDAPQPPKLVLKTINSLSLKWNAAVENGSVITGYSLECDGGKGDMTFAEVYNGVHKQVKLNNLNAATSYTFRLAAYNALGKSEFSRMISHTTSGTAPTQPDPPMLSESFSSNLTISWIRRPNDDQFTLMMMEANDENKTFSTVYNGSGLSFNVQNLYRNSEYKFKLQASNEEGSSEWSDVVKYKTLPDIPCPCSPPKLVGDVTPESFTISWDPPQDDGGQEVTHYLVQLDNNKNKLVKKCVERSYEATELKAGIVHSIRVTSVNSVGCSDWSEELKIRTKCVAPGMCYQPKLAGKPQGSCVSIKWTCPEETGGSEVTRYELMIRDEEENTTTEVYGGPDDSCTVNSLTPGRRYLFKIRAVNVVGPGPWSESLEVTSGALPPDAPEPPVVVCSSPYQATITWEEPPCNGSPIVEYKLEWQQLESEFSQLYVGAELLAQVSGMLAASLYSFRVQAINSIGCGPFSPATSCMTPPSHPGPITCIYASSTSNSIHLSWKEPLDNGCAITGYYLSIDERGVVPLDISNGFEHVIENLTPETVYKIRIQAVNSIGLGPFSSTLKIATHSPPPAPPFLECVVTTYNSLKLKWRDSRNRLDSSLSGIGGSGSCSGGSSGGGSNGPTSYCLEMLRESGEPQTLYYGPGHCFKVTKLSELSEYQFRVCSSNQDGKGPFSEIFKFMTSKAPPPVIKSPKVAYITSEACTVEWPGLRSMGQDSMYYILQMQNAFGRDQTFKEIYRGPSTSYRVSGLLPTSEYRLRVCAVRQPKDSSNQELVGSFSQMNSFVTTSLKSNNFSSSDLVKVSSKSSSESVNSGLGLTDQQWAIALLICFTIFAILVACLAQYVISRHQLGGESILSSGSEPSIPSPVTTTTSEKRD